MLKWENQSLSKCSWDPGTVVCTVIIMLDWLRPEDHMLTGAPQQHPILKYKENQFLNKKMNLCWELDTYKYQNGIVHFPSLYMNSTMKFGISPHYI